MTGTEQTYRLDHLIQNQHWDKLVAIDPAWVATVLSFSDTYRLTKSNLFAIPEDLGSDYCIRLLYALKRLTPSKWQAYWGHELHLGSSCSMVLRYHEEYHAYMRAACVVQPTPPTLALSLSDCFEVPSPLVTKRDAINWSLYALREYPCLSALQGLKSLYRFTEGKEDEVEKYSRMIEEKGATWPDMPPTSQIVELNDFNAPAASLEVTIRTATSEQIAKWIREEAWSSFHLLDPRCVVEALPFEDVLSLAYRFLQDSPESKEYAVRLLYLLRLLQLGPWFESWRHNAFLGYACELTGKWDEQFAWYDMATRDFFDSPLPPSLCIALARCCFAPHFPSVTYNRAIELLQQALEDEPYIEALHLLRRIYALTGQHANMLEMDKAIVDQRRREIASPSPLPPDL